MDILYLVGDKNVSDFEDLKLSLRSLDMYGKGVDRVFMCGFIPSFISDNVIKIPFEILPFEDLQEKARNIYKQILYAIEQTDIGMYDEGEFLVSMDDHYITKPTDFGDNYPFYVKDYVNRGCRHMLPEKFEDGFKSTNYQKFLVDCCGYLKEIGLPFYNFCPHRNMHMNRYLIEELSDVNKDIFDNKRPVEAFCLINNYRLSKNPDLNYEINIDFKTDNQKRLIKYINSGGNFFSINDFKFGDKMHKFLYSLFPFSSKYEK